MHTAFVYDTARVVSFSALREPRTRRGQRTAVAAFPPLGMLHV